MDGWMILWLIISFLFGGVGATILVPWISQSLASQRRRTSQVLRDPGYHDRLVWGPLEDRRPLPERLRRRLQRLQAAVRAEGSVHTPAAVPLAYYESWLGNAGNAVQIVRQALRLDPTTSDEVHLLLAGGTCIVGWETWEELAQAESWCRRAMQICDDDRQREKAGLATLCIHVLRLRRRLGGRNHDEVRRSIRAMKFTDQCTQARQRLLLAKVDLDDSTPRKGEENHRPYEQGMMPVPAHERTALLNNCVTGCRAARDHAQGADDAHRLAVEQDALLGEALALTNLGEYESAHECALRAVDAAERLENAFAVASAFQQASRASRLMTKGGESKVAEREAAEALRQWDRCDDPRGQLRANRKAALVLSMAAIHEKRDGPIEVMNHIWKELTAREVSEDPEYSRQLLSGMIRLRRDRLDVDPPYWKQVLERAVQYEIPVETESGS